MSGASYRCLHLWSAPTTAGTIECLWCGAKQKAPLQYPTSTTAQPALAAGCGDGVGGE